MDGQPDTVIAFRDKAYLVDGENGASVKTVVQELLPFFPRLAPYLHDMSHPEDIADHLKDVFVAKYDGKTLVPEDTLNSPGTSDLVKKVATLLGAKVAGHERLGGGWPDVMYHGTTSDRVGNIRRYGLMPGHGVAIAGTIGREFGDRIFLTTSQQEAEIYAVRASETSDEDVQPVVVTVRVPDPARLSPDFDVDGGASRSHYKHNDLFSNFTFSVGTERAGRHVGLVSYVGRIPPSHILGIKVL